LRIAADVLGKQVLVLTASSDAEIEAAFPTAVQQGVGALFVNVDPFLLAAASSSPRWRRDTAFPRSTRCANLSWLAD
jgi:hypothetical protein